MKTEIIVFCNKEDSLKVLAQLDSMTIKKKAQVKYQTILTLIRAMSKSAFYHLKQMSKN